MCRHRRFDDRYPNRSASMPTIIAWRSSLAIEEAIPFYIKGFRKVRAINMEGESGGWTRYSINRRKWSAGQG